MPWYVAILAKSNSSYIKCTGEQQKITLTFELSECDDGETIYKQLEQKQILDPTTTETLGTPKVNY